MQHSSRILQSPEFLAILRYIHWIDILVQNFAVRSTVRSALTGSVVSSLRVIPGIEAIVLKRITRHVSVSDKETAPALLLMDENSLARLVAARSALTRSVVCDNF